MGLFWYPEKACKHELEQPFDKSVLIEDYVTYFLNRLQSMFKYDGLPDTIPAKWLENYLLCNGNCLWLKDGDDLIVSTGGWGGIPDRYYIPKDYIISNPYVKPETRKTYTIGDKCVLMRNDTYVRGVLPILYKFARQLTENDITMQVSDILARAMLMITATNEHDKESVDRWLKKLMRGELAAIGELPSMVGNQDRSINVTPFREVASILTDLIEYHQYLKAGLFNELGLNSNYNMKRESINSNESQLNDDMLHPLIDDMLKCRKEALKQINEMFDTNITVEFNSAWKDNEIENQALIDSITETPEDTETPEESEAPEESEQNNIVDAINNLTDAVEDIAESVEGE